MKYIITADLHLSDYSNDPVVKGLSEKLYYTLKVLDNITKYSEDNNIKNIIIAGDIIHTKSIIHTVAQSSFLDFIRRNEHLNFIVIDGNHDLSSRSNSGVSALKFLDSEKNIFMAHESCILPNSNIWLVPWNPEKMIKDIIDGPENLYLVSHLGVNEAKLSSGISIVSDISIRSFKKYKYCFLGHYHKPQDLENISYIGDPIQMDWGEKHEEKRFMILDTDNGNISSIPTIGYKKHFEFDLTIKNRDEVLKKCKELKDEGHNIKLNRTEDFDVKDIEKIYRIVDKIEKDLTNRGINSSMSLSEKFKKYLEIKNIPSEKRDFYIKCGLKIVNDLEKNN